MIPPVYSMMNMALLRIAKRTEISYTMSVMKEMRENDEDP